jgi:hydrogenase maturation protease
MSDHTAIVIGVGNEYRCDDALGPTVVGLLRELDLPGVDFAESDGEPSGLMDLWEGFDLAVVVDAVRTDPARPGRVHRMSAHHPSLGAAGATSSHGVDPGEVIALARALDRLPARLMLYAVEVADTGFGVGLSPDVADAARLIADEITDYLSKPVES